MKMLTAKEEEIMGYFWEKGPLFVKQLLDFYDEPRPHFNTLSTIVRGLEEKGFLSHEVFGNTYQYYAVVSCDDFKKKTLKGVISKYFNNSYLGAVSSLVKEEEISLDELKQLIRDVDSQNGARVPTGVLNEMLARATARMQPPSDKGRRLKIFYLTQASTRPPTFVAFVNSKQLFHFSYQRYLINQIRENFGLEHTPIRLVIRERGTGSVGAKDV